MVFFKVVL